jgi:NADH dehydrogenase
MRVFIAGGTGATGQVVVPEATKAGHDLVLHVRPQSAEKSPLGKDPRARIFDLTDGEKLKEAMAGCPVVISLVGTMRNRFAAGDTYESSDIGSTQALVSAARSVGAKRFLLLSSYGAGGIGAYLKMKGECERIVRESGLSFTIFRPSTLISPEGATESAHGVRKAPPGMGAVVGAIGVLPGLGGWRDRVKPIGIDVVARAIVKTIEKVQDRAILQGGDLYRLGDG